MHPVPNFYIKIGNDGPRTHRGRRGRRDTVTAAPRAAARRDRGNAGNCNNCKVDGAATATQCHSNSKAQRSTRASGGLSESQKVLAES